MSEISIPFPGNLGQFVITLYTGQWNLILIPLHQCMCFLPSTERASFKWTNFLAYYSITNIQKQFQLPRAIGRQKQNPDSPCQMAFLGQKVLPGGPVAPWPPGKPGRPIRHSAGFPGKPGSPRAPGEPRSPKRNESGFTAKLSFKLSVNLV